MTPTRTSKLGAQDYLICLIAFGLFIWPFLLLGFLHTQLLLTSLSPVATQPERVLKSIDERVLDKHGLATQPPRKTENTTLFAMFHLTPQGVQNLSFKPSCDGANFTKLSASAKVFKLKSKIPITAIACFPVHSEESVFTYIEDEQPGARGRTQSRAKGYFVVVHGASSKESYLIAFKLSSSEAHVAWARLEQKLPD